MLIVFICFTNRSKKKKYLYKFKFDVIKAHYRTYKIDRGSKKKVVLFYSMYDVFKRI